jgi:RNA polymerase sigma factor (sigma-70 family)
LTGRDSSDNAAPGVLTQQSLPGDFYEKNAHRRRWARRGDDRRPARGERCALNIRSWFISARNEVLTRKRNAGRHLNIEERTLREEQSAYELEVNDPIERARLRRALAALPAEQRVALELAYFGHLTHVQVAERLHIPLGTTKSRIALGLRKLKAATTQGGAGAV